MTKKIVTIIRGISGAGKSTYIKKHLPADAKVVSADHYFVNPNTGFYAFNPTKLGAAHQQCKDNFVSYLQDGVDHIVVDNTNTMKKEMRFYVEQAKNFGYEIQVVRLVAPVSVCAGRNVHAVPRQAVQNMCNRMQELDPSWGIDEKVVRTG